MTAQLLTDLSIEAYHADKNRLSKSMLSDFADCPARFKYLHMDGGEPKQTKSLKLGNAVHVLALEPEKWASGYHVLPETYFNSDGEEKPFRADPRMQAYKDEMAKAGDKIILKRDEYNIIQEMANSLVKNPLAVSLLKSPGYVESSILWEKDGIGFRCRPDLMRNDGLIVDLKTARSVKPSVFFSDAENHKYHLSVALTCRGYEALYGKMPEEYVFLCIETEAPYLVSCFSSFEIMDDMYGMSYHGAGELELSALLAQYKQCKETNIWPSYQEKIEKMRRPRWAMGI